MKTLLQNKYVTLSFDPEQSFFLMVFRRETEFMTIEQYKADMLKCADFMKKNKHIRFLTDLTHFHFILNPELQRWINEDVFNYPNPPDYRTAVVISSDFVAQIGVEQMAEERPESGQGIQYFPTVEEAKKWLFS